MTNYIFVIAPVHERDAFIQLLQKLQLKLTRWTVSDIAVVICADSDAYQLRVALENKRWEFLLSSSRQTSREYVGNELLNNALREQWTLVDAEMND